MTRRVFGASLVSLAAFFGYKARNGFATPISLESGVGTEADPLLDRLKHGALDDVSSPLLNARLQVANLLREAVPSESTCGRCLFPWVFVRPHTVYYEGLGAGLGAGMFAICEDCWQELGEGSKRLPYYLEVLKKDGWSGVTEQQITDAVLRPQH